MRRTQLFVKTSKESVADDTSINAQLLQRGGFIYKEMAGVYTFLPLGLRVLNKIEQIIRKHINTIGSEVCMTALAPTERRSNTHRLDKVDVLMKTSGANELSKNKSSNEYILNSTHEEMITPIMQHFIKSYKDLPTAAYQIQTKFRNEARAKSGLLRGREFKMKDLYSFHTSKEDLMSYYESCKGVYMNIYRELGIGDDTFITLASGGDFTTEFSHEFQTICDAGEDDIYLDRVKNIAYNKEVIDDPRIKNDINLDQLELVKASEVGNIFPLETKFTNALNFYYTDEQNQKQIVRMGSYGIGPSRLMGILVEKFHDEKGIIWPKQVAPFLYVIIPLKSQHNNIALYYYEQLSKKGIEVIIDDRDCSPGIKFGDADLWGIPYQLVISDKILEQGSNKIELIDRQTGSKQIITIEDIQ